MTTVTPALGPVVVAPGESRAPQPVDVLGHKLSLKISAGDTGGAFAVGVLKAPPKTELSQHLNAQADTWFYVLDGELAFELDGRQITAGPGASIFAARGVPHGWQNLTREPAEALVMVTPPEQ